MNLLKKHLKNVEFDNPDIIEKSIIDPESEQVSKILPDELYKKVARIVGLDENVKVKIHLAKRKNYKRLYKGIRNISRALPSITVEKDTTEEYYSDSSVEPPSPRLKPDDPNTNPYFDFFNKTEREQVTWKSNYLPPETEMEKGLIRRADDLTTKICTEFCTYMRSLGGYDSPLFQEDIVKELFQIEFNAHIVRSLQICPQEMISVPEQVAFASKYRQAQHKEVLRRQIVQNVMAEKRPVKKTAFGKNLPKNMQWKPPSNNTKENWQKLHHLPQKVTTLENVWGDITKLKSVHDFCQWIIDHPSSKSPIFSNTKNLKSITKVYKYDERNLLPKIDIKKQLSGKRERTISEPPDSIKITINEISRILKNL